MHEYLFILLIHDNVSTNTLRLCTTAPLTTTWLTYSQATLDHVLIYRDLLVYFLLFFQDKRIGPTTES